jgi:hypothetical protein
MDSNALAAARAGKPMIPQQQVPNRYPLNSYYTHPSPMGYQPQSQVPQPPHRSLSQGSNPNYSMPSTPVPSNGAGGKPTLIDSIEPKSEELMDDPSKQQQQQQQQQIFHSLLQSRSRPQTPSYYSNMPQPNSPYYASQRPMTPAPDYNMATARGIRPSPAAYGTLPVQQRVRTPLASQLSSSTSDPTTGMNNNPMGLRSTPPPPSVTPR